MAAHHSISFLDSGVNDSDDWALVVLNLPIVLPLFKRTWQAGSFPCPAAYH